MGLLTLGFSLNSLATGLNLTVIKNITDPNKKINVSVSSENNKSVYTVEVCDLENCMQSAQLTEEDFSVKTKDLVNLLNINSNRELTAATTFLLAFGLTSYLDSTIKINPRHGFLNQVLKQVLKGVTRKLAIATPIAAAVYGLFPASQSGDSVAANSEFKEVLNLLEDSEVDLSQPTKTISVKNTVYNSLQEAITLAFIKAN